MKTLKVIWLCMAVMIFGCERRQAVPTTIGGKIVPGPPLSVKTAEQMTLYSIDFRYLEDRPEDRPPYHGETFHDYPVLGKVEIADEEQRRSLISAFNVAIGRAPEIGASCFWPRHGLRAVEDGKTLDYVICFECSRFLEFIDGVQTRGGQCKTPGLLDSEVGETFNSPLIEAGIPIVPKE